MLRVLPCITLLVAVTAAWPLAAEAVIADIARLKAPQAARRVLVALEHQDARRLAPAGQDDGRDTAAADRNLP